MMDAQLTTEIIIESTALVANSTKIKIVSTTGNTTKGADIYQWNNTDTNTTTHQDNNNTMNLQLIIAHGNIFHPHSKLTILIPSLPSLQSLLSTSLICKHYNLTLKIGEYNLFEEDCDVTFELSPLSILSSWLSLGVDSEKQQHQETITIPLIKLLGSYNHFTAKSKVYSNQIGNGNIFHSFCDLHFVMNYSHGNNNNNNNDTMKSNDWWQSAHNNSMMHNTKKDPWTIIGNGNIFHSFVIMKYDERIGLNDDANKTSNTGISNYNSHSNNYENDDHNHPYFTNKIFFIINPLMKNEQRSVIQSRHHDNGVKKNIKDVTLLLSSMKAILINYHSFMTSSKTITN